MKEFDGKIHLHDLIKKAGYKSVNELVAEKTLFTHPDTVKQTNNQNIFRVIRDFNKRGQIVDWNDGKKVMCCDNEGPNRSFVWSNGDFKYSDVQFNHIYSDSKNVEVYTSIANICVTPAFLAKLTDTDEETKALLKYRAFDIYGFYIGTQPIKPENYDFLKWREFHSPIDNLEKYLLKRLSECRLSRSSRSAAEIGWYFSKFEPDLRIY